ncbi:MAG: hypothetical protein ACYDEN_02575 [Acidimicrobiales bacterium]
MEPLLAEADRAVWMIDEERTADVARGAGVEMGLEGQAHDLPAAPDRLALELGKTNAGALPIGEVLLELEERLEPR